MSINTSIDLAFFYQPGQVTQPDWQYGEKRALALPLKHMAFTIDCLVKQTSAEWILFWDFSLGQPDMALIQELASRPVDVWHAGAKMGVGALPMALNYIDPAWMYNREASQDIEHTSFRLSIRACLVRTSAIKIAGGISPLYQSLEMAGVAWGYSILKQGGIIRYHPQLVSKATSIEQVPDYDEWVFTRQFFSKKWHLWSLLNGGNFRHHFRLLSKTKGVKQLDLKPRIHASDGPLAAVPEGVTVSVLMPTLSRYSYLLNELEQMAKQTVLPYEILITDQTDKDQRTPPDFSAYPNLNIRYFPQDDKGQVIAWNKLMEEATGEFVLFLDDDADGIRPDFIHRLLSTQQKFDCEMVASNVVELGINYQQQYPYYYTGDTLPITLMKRTLLSRTGLKDMFFNRNIRADGDLAVRCHLSGALIVFDPSAVVYHHRAPAGGLRTHNARVVTSYMSKNSISKIVIPTSSELYLLKKYFSKEQYKYSVRVKYMSQLAINGNVIKKLLRLVVLFFKLPALRKAHRANEQAANEAIKKLEDAGITYH